jgi:ABC-type dipeptide/oligopeptide/nickel transport system permease subunit
VITRFFDLVWAFPVILLSIALARRWRSTGFHHFGLNLEGDSLWIPTLVISYVLIPYIGRPLRGQILSLREKEFVEASIAQGASSFRVMFSEILPNIASSTFVFFALIIANNILLEAALSFLGAGIQDPKPSWGKLICRRSDAHHDRAVADDRARHRDRPDRGLAEHLRRRPSRRARPALEGPNRALMLTFIAQRVIGMISC